MYQKSTRMEIAGVNLACEVSKNLRGIQEIYQVLLAVLDASAAMEEIKVLVLQDLREGYGLIWSVHTRQSNLVVLGESCNVFGDRVLDRYWQGVSYLHQGSGPRQVSAGVVIPPATP
jgi:hypothetical protein